MDQIMYSSTRGGESGVTASRAILEGIAKDGGLFMPDHFPKLDRTLEELAGMDYRGTAYEVMKLFLTDYTGDELRTCVANAYDSKFDSPEIAPMHYADGAWYLELYHGRTIAFKDMALSILPHLMTVAAKKNQVKNDIVILTATSGDTGKAAMAGFQDVPGTKIIVFYPKGGVSRVQELQMVTQKGANTYVVGITGNFDDAQSGVKKIFGDRAFADRLDRAGMQLSSANSINIGRLIPQVVYYVYAYTRLLRDGKIKSGEPVNFTVPTGNFGNILAAYFAKQIGVPVHRLICASNDNKVLYDFFTTGTYDRNREFILTTSPSMDILISSNLERLIYLSCGSDAAKTAELMRELSEKGRYTVTEDMRARMSDFTGGYATQEDNADEIRHVFETAHYLIDTHTGVASRVYRDYVKKTGDTAPTIIASTASPYKFATSVMSAIRGENERKKDDFVLIDEMEKMSGVPIPPAIREIRTAPVRHNNICDPAGMESMVAKLLKL
jgi:threonine synthase